MNERTHFFIKIYPSHFILERIDVGSAWEVSWRREQTAIYWPKVLLTIAAFLLRPSWAAQPWVTEGRKPAVCKLILTQASCPQLQLELTDWPWLYNCLTLTCFLWSYASAPNSTMSTGQGDIPISSTGCTCFAILPLIYSGAYLDWRLDRGSVCYTINNHQLEAILLQVPTN